MNIKIILTEKLLNTIFDNEAKKLVGKVCKRFEISNNQEEIKKQVKELIYESLRDINDIIKLNKEAIHLINTDEQK